MVSYRLMINDSKTEFLIIGSRGRLSKININSIMVGDSIIEPVKSTRNLGSWFDEHMAMDFHIGNICNKAFKGLYNIRHFHSTEATKILIHASVTSHLDYCNSLLSGLPKYQLDRLQKVLNAAARVVCLVPKFNHISPHLKDLHWLPVEFRIEFKILLLVFKALNGIAPRYICDLIREKTSIKSSLRANDLTLLGVPRAKCKTFGDQAFAFAGPSKWNKLPLAIRTAKNLNTFKKHVKTFLFKKAYDI